MSGTSPISGLPYKQLSDPANANSLNQDLTSALDHIVLPKYATATARDAANPTPVIGDRCYVTGTGDQQWDGTAWYTFDSLMVPTSYTPAWTTTTGAHIPTIGNGVYSCTYTRVGRLILVRFKVVFGSTTNFNSGTASDNWTWTLPFTSAVSSGGYGVMFLSDVSAGVSTICQAVADSTNAFHVNVAGAATAAAIDAVTPFTFASGDVVEGQLFYARA